MIEFLIYQGKVAVVLTVFYMFYRLLLSKDTFHRFNRIVLLGTAALSFVLPLCVITIHKVVTLPAVQATGQVFEGTVVGVVTAAEASQPLWPYVTFAVFAVGALGVLAIAIISIIKVVDIISKGEHQILEGGEVLVIVDAGTVPFSWMRYIVLSREDYESGYTQILTHERAHIALRHSWDIIFVDMITALQWFNPAMWMLKADLRAIHEFEADDAVLRSGADIKEYQYLLIRKAVSKSGYSVANSFNHSTLKARITMMLNKKSSRLSAWKSLYVLPLVGISLGLTVQTKTDYVYEEQTSMMYPDTLKTGVDKVHVDSDLKVIKISSQSQEGNPIDEPVTIDSTANGSIKVKSIDKDAPRPLYVIDGQVMPEDYSMEALDPADIASIEVFKDGSQTSVYGDKAKDGVVFITLKKKEEEKLVRFIPVSEPIGNLEEYDEFKLYSAEECGKVISYEEYQKMPEGTITYLYVQHLYNGGKSLHVYTVDYNSIVHLRKCRRTTDINDEKLAGVNDNTIIFVDGREDNYKGYLRTLKYKSDQIKEIEYCLKKDRKSISMVSVIFDREYDKEEITIIR